MSEEVTIEREVTPTKQLFRLRFIQATNILGWLFLMFVIGLFFMPLEFTKDVLIPNIRLFCLIEFIWSAVIAGMYWLLSFTRTILPGEKREMYLAGLGLFGVAALGFGYMSL